MAETTEKEMKVVFERPHSLLPVVTNFCPGCPHGIVERLVCEVMDELDIEGETIGVGARWAVRSSPTTSSAAT